MRNGFLLFAKAYKRKKLSRLNKRVIIIALSFTSFFSWYTINKVKAQASKIDFERRITLLHNNVYRCFYDSANGLYYDTNHVKSSEKLHSYLWPLCALIQAANEDEALYPSGNFMAPVLKAISQYYSDIPPAPAYQAYVTKEQKIQGFMTTING